MISKVFHLFVTVYYFFVAYYLHTQLDFSKATHPTLLTVNKFHHRYFTGWNIILQSLCFSICVFDDVFSLTPASFLAKFKSKLRSWKSYFFLTFAFPTTMLVAFVFWSLFNYDRELIYPAVVDSVIPLWLNHAIHTGIVLTAGLELVLTPHTCSRRQGIVGINALFGIYEACLLYTFFTHDVWLYPIFKMFTWLEVLGFGVFLHLVGTGFFLLGSAVSTSLWRKVVKKLNKESSKQSKQQTKPQSKQQKKKAKQSPQQSPQQSKQSPQQPKKEQTPQQPKQQSPQQPKQQSPKQPKQQTKQQSPQTQKQVSKQQSPQQPKQNGSSTPSKKKEKMK